MLRKSVCEGCGSNNLRVISSRISEKDGYRRRRYRCRDCGCRFTRYEVSKKEFLQLKQLESQNTGETNWHTLRSNKLGDTHGTRADSKDNSGVSPMSPEVKNA